MNKIKIVNVIKSILSIIKINIIIIYYKIINKKIIFFYHPKKLLTLNNVYYLDELFSNFSKEYLIIYGHEVENYSNNNYFFVLDFMNGLVKHFNLFFIR